VYSSWVRSPYRTANQLSIFVFFSQFFDLHVSGLDTDIVDALPI
jgi:hypothetical protein